MRGFGGTCGIMITKNKACEIPAKNAFMMSFKAKCCSKVSVNNTSKIILI